MSHVDAVDAVASVGQRRPAGPPLGPRCCTAARHKVLLGEAAGHRRRAVRTDPGQTRANNGIALAYDGMEIDL